LTSIVKVAKEVAALIEKLPRDQRFGQRMMISTSLNNLPEREQERKLREILASLQKSIPA
jgi:hypothetical protein